MIINIIIIIKMINKIKKFLIVSIIITLFFWLIFYTFQPDFLKSDDFVLPGNPSRGGDRNNSDKYLSDRGRSSAFLLSLIIGLLLGFLYFLYDYYYYKDYNNLTCKKTKNKLVCNLNTN